MLKSWREWDCVCVCERKRAREVMFTVVCVCERERAREVMFTVVCVCERERDREVMFTVVCVFKFCSSISACKVWHTCPSWLVNKYCAGFVYGYYACKYRERYVYAVCVETGGKCIVCVCMCVLLLSKKKCKMIGRKYVLLLSKLRCIYVPVFEDQRNACVCVCRWGSKNEYIYVHIYICR